MYVDKPLEVLPLSEALYMGQDKIYVRDDEEEDYVFINFIIFINCIDGLSY